MMIIVSVMTLVVSIVMPIVLVIVVSVAVVMGTISYHVERIWGNSRIPIMLFRTRDTTTAMTAATTTLINHETKRNSSRQIVSETILSLRQASGLKQNAF